MYECENVAKCGWYGILVKRMVKAYYFMRCYRTEFIAAVFSILSVIALLAYMKNDEVGRSIHTHYKYLRV